MVIAEIFLVTGFSLAFFTAGLLAAGKKRSSDPKTGVTMLLDGLEHVPVSSIGVLRRGDTDPITHVKVATTITIVRFIGDTVELRVAERLDDKSWTPDIVVSGALMPQGTGAETVRLFEVARYKMAELAQDNYTQLLLGDGMV